MLTIFIVKMTATVLPAFKSYSEKADTSVIQSEADDKADKNSLDKDQLKGKFEDFIHANALAYSISSPILHINILFNQDHGAYQQSHHPSVPTPPPDQV